MTPTERKPLDPFKPPVGITTEAAMKYGLHEDNIEQVKALCARDAKHEAIEEAKRVAIKAFRGEMAVQGYRLVPEDADITITLTYTHKEKSK